MPMTIEQTNQHQAEGAAGAALNEKIQAFIAANAAAASANAALAQKASDLTAAWLQFKAADTALNNLLLVAPEGFTPPV